MDEERPGRAAPAGERPTAGGGERVLGVAGPTGKIWQVLKTEAPRPLRRGWSQRLTAPWRQEMW